VDRWTYRPELDGLRSVAVYLVLLFHCGLGPLDGGFVGVDLFFVLSGFLVSHVIWAEVDKRGTVRPGQLLGWFYARRVRRLLPAAVLVIVTTAALQLLVASTPQRAGMVRDGQAALVYLSNWQFIADSRDYFAADSTDTSPFLHYWSLSIEEQFYVVLPLVLLVLLRLRRSARTVLLVLAAVVVASVGLQLWRAAGDPTYAYYATETRIYQLAAGVLLAQVTRLVTIPVVRARVLALVGVVGIVVVGSSLVDVSASVRGLLATLFSVAAIAGLYGDPQGPTSRLLALPAPRYLGQISYGTYLWHWPLILVLRDVFDVRPLVLALVAAPVATGLAALSYQLFERPIRRAEPLEKVRWPVVTVGLAVSAVIAAVVLPPVLHAEVRPAVQRASKDGPAGAGGVPWADDPVPAGLDLVGALGDVPDAGDPCTVDDLDICVLESGSRQRVLLIGDSQTAMFVTAFRSLAREHDFTLLTNVVRGCAWPAGLVPRCGDELETFYRDVLPQLDVDVVVAVSLARYEKRWQVRLDSPDRPPGETLAQLHLRKTSETVEKIHAAGARLIIVKALLGTEGYLRNGPDPLDCLARAERLGDCALIPPIGKPFTDAIMQTLAIESPDDTATVDLNPVLCPDYPICRPISGRTIVWKDAHHVTGTFLDEQRADIWARLRATGLLD
jgi:peptidoglycan/LPS O-acetylase OafA/YrhL